MTSDDRRRGVATTLGYVLMLSVASLLVIGLLTTGGGFVSDQREQVIEAELEVVGQQIAGDVMAADRLVQAAGGSPDEVRIVSQRPSDVTGSTYQVTLEPGPDPHLELRSTQPRVTVTVPLSTETDIGDSSVGGGDIAIEYDDSSDELVIDDV